MSTFWNLVCYFFIYSFLGWVFEVVVYSVRNRKLTNRGFFTWPLCPSYGLGMLFLIEIYPHIEDDIFIFRYVVAVVVAAVIMTASGHLIKDMTGHRLWKYEDSNLFSGNWRSLIMGLVLGLVYMTAEMLIQPFLSLIIPRIPTVIKAVIGVLLIAMVLVDLVLIMFCMHRYRTRDDTNKLVSMVEEGGKHSLEQRLSHMIFSRLDKAYPEWEGESKEELPVFAQGFCFYKMVWVFLLTAIIGDIVETIFVGIVGGHWMSRSSLVYGPFSVVWGFGAIILTITLHPLAKKAGQYIFLAGCLIGGVYEYTMSVLAEDVLHTQFWDYSKMPFNIGGRTNLLYMIFWGALGYVWVRYGYPPLSRLVEKIPVITGTVLTWVIIVLFLVDGILSAGVLWRYSDRKEHPKASNAIETFLDENYPDKYVEQRWQNMTSKKSGSGGSEKSSDKNGNTDEKTESNNKSENEKKETTKEGTKSSRAPTAGQLALSGGA